MRDHTKLRAFELANEVAVLIYRVTRRFPKEEMYGLTSPEQSCWCHWIRIGSYAKEARIRMEQMALAVENLLKGLKRQETEVRMQKGGRNIQEAGLRGNGRNR